MWKCSLGPPAFEQNNHHEEKVQVGIPLYDALGDYASRRLVASTLGGVQLEEGLRVEDQERACQGGSTQGRAGSRVRFLCDFQSLLRDGSQAG